MGLLRYAVCIIPCMCVSVQQIKSLDWNVLKQGDPGRGDPCSHTNVHLSSAIEIIELPGLWPMARASPRKKPYGHLENSHKEMC